jgi:HAD superfamily hydrolase (TIGR01509 family)
MDGATLLDSLAGDADDDTRKRAKELHSKYYKETTGLLRLLPGTRDLLDQVKALGLQVVLATSAPEDELEILRDVLDSEELVSAVTSSADVETAKPKPDIVEVALERAGVDAERAVFVGDAVWDIVACERAGLTAIGLLSGGVSREELENSGARAVFENPADLLAQIGRSPIAALTDQGSG